MRSTIRIAALAMAFVSGPAFGQDKPITDRDVDAVDVATTPMTDLNLRKDKIPQVLMDAQSRPYDLAGLKKCVALENAVEQLNAVLGGDIDLPQEQRNRISAGRVAKSVVGSFIPFRGIIREVSGANEQERRIQAAIEAGIARRSYLKGVGQVRGCNYPARAATVRDVNVYLHDRARQEQAEAAEKARKREGSKPAKPS